MSRRLVRRRLGLISLGAGELFEFVVISPCASADCAPAIAASRAGALGVTDLTFVADPTAALARLERVARLSRGGWGVQTDDPALLATILAAGFHELDTVLVTAPQPAALGDLVEQVVASDRRAYAVATSLEQAVAAHARGATAVIAKGHECGGWVGDEGAFVLFQRLVVALTIPVWIQGGIGLNTVAAAWAGGAAGAILDAQLLLTRDGGLGAAERAAVAAMDGSETTTLGSELGAAVRLYSRPGLGRLDALAEQERGLSSDAPHSASADAWCAAVKEAVGDSSLAAGLLPIGQDACLARTLADRFGTVAGVLDGLRESLAQAAVALVAGNPLSEDAPLARSHGTRYPIAQGPMTRVSDRAEFAAAVAHAGALPFLALALLRGPEVDALLRETGERAGERPWGVGILGFVPPALRAEQLEVVRRHRPPFALIAGGRPDQAQALEELGIATYLHVPSPGLLKLYLAQGARRFVFEGRECGGHVGPRSSLVLWESMLEILLEADATARAQCQVLFAGGIHDARSSAMVAAAAARVTAGGVKAGVLLGTAYLFTSEATETGAITETFQQAAIAAERTELLESGPGHATRCLPSPFVDQFAAAKRQLRRDGLEGEELRQRLEELNIGRLRIAAKGADRNPAHAADATAPRLVALDAIAQWDAGLYMIGQVASLHSEVGTLATLHDDVSAGSGEILDDLTAPGVVERAQPAPPPADVAIVGVGCILPGAPDIPTYWANILDGVDAVDEIPSERWDWRRMYDPEASTPDRVNSRWGGFIDPVAFDPLAAGIPPRSLSSIEPFQLLALVTAQAALRDAGYATRPFARERTSVILGAGGGGADLSVGYTVRSMLPSLLGDAYPELEQQLNERLPEWTEDSFAGLLMNVAAGRIANRLDLGGTNYTVDAACASSLAAIGLAVRELQLGTSDMVLAGGVDAIQNPFAYLCFAKTRALSPRGRCRPFDAGADGIAISEGFATVVLKRRADAERDGDRIYAVIRAVGAASDGRDRSLTAPRPEGQMLALRRAYAQARVSPATVGMVEAHGTGTVAGDSAEVQALSRVFAEHGTPNQACAIGSVKSMIGHTKATAGVAGLVKAALALHHQVLPPTIGVTEPNPHADFPSSPFYVNSEARPWLTAGADHPRRAGVSAFGFGGTNFHVVLEEYTDGHVAERAAAVRRWPAELLLWRGSPDEIAAALAVLMRQLAAGATPELADLAFTVSLAAPAPSREQAALAIVAESLEDLQAKLAVAAELVTGDAERRHAPNGVHWTRAPLAADGAVAFLFPGQGSQTVDMARDLTVAFPQAREPFELADRVLAGAYEQPLSRYVFPPPSFTEDDARRRQQELTHTHRAQAALGAAELAYLRVLGGLGVEAQMTAGHSYGELVALAAAGALDDEALLRLSEARGRLMTEAAAGEPGGMAAVDAAPQALAALLMGDSSLVVANLNGPAQTVLSGPQASIDRAASWCAEHELRVRPLAVACAFHSPHVAGAQRRFAEELARTQIAQPRLPVYSNTTGGPHAQDPREIASVLARHLASPVQFMTEIERMHDAGARVFVEVGPRAVLSGLADQILGEREHLAVPVDRSGRSGLVALLHCLAALASEGVPVRIEQLFAGREPVRLSRGRLAAPAPATSPGGWLIDGGEARPSSVPRSTPSPVPPPSAAPSPPTAPPPSPRPEERTPVANLSTNGNGHHPVPASTDRTADVMVRYQQLMAQFLETERAVMLGYLQGSAHPAPERAWPAQPPATQLVATTQAAFPPAPAPAPPPAAAPAIALDTPFAWSAPAPVAEQPAPPIAPAVQAAAPVPAAAPAPGVALDRDAIESRLLEIVSDRTGYPTEMLGIDADLEGDLGIDSIKRVEIAGSFTQTLDERQRAAIDMEEITTCRTLRAVIEVLERGSHGGPASTIAAVTAPFEARPAETERIGRFVVSSTSAPAIPASAVPAADGVRAGGVVLIAGDGTPLGPRLAAAVDNGVLLERASLPRDEQEADDLAARLEGEHGHGAVRTLIHLAADDEPFGGLESLYLLARALGEQLAGAGERGGAGIVGVIRRGGDARAVSGFLKSLALEWPAVRVKAIDFVAIPEAPAPADDELAERVLAELDAADGLVDVAYRGGERIEWTLHPRPLGGRPERAPLDERSVVLVTGGARGITAAAALALAERYRPTLVLVGRTPLADEPAATAGLGDPAELRRALLDARRGAGGPLTPALVEADCRRILRGREVRETVASIERAGARVEYRSCDVADEAAFGSLLDDVYARHGRIDGVIHGAGVIEDRLIVDKRLDSLRRVLAAKAGSAATLSRRLRPEGLRFLVLFSSVAGRFGNRGQADYAAASEGLGGLARELDARWPGRVVAIDWGPWSGVGMAAPLEAEFTRRGIALIDVREGARMLVDELARGEKGEAEVVIGAARGLSMPADEPHADGTVLLHGIRPSPSAGRLAIARTLELSHDLYLDHHRVDGRPVLPFAVAMEFIAEAALLASPGRPLAGMRTIRLLKGITLPESGGLPIEIAAAPDGDDVAVEIAAAPGGRVHYRATVTFGADGQVVGMPAELAQAPPFPLELADAYRDLLFHGPLFQGITRIAGMDARGSSATLRASDPGACVAGAGGRPWLLDPVMLDSALQIQVLWARLHWDVTLLPAEIGRYERLGVPRPGEAIRHEMRVRPESAAPMCRCDHWFIGRDGRPLAILGEVVGVGSRALNRLAASSA